MLPILGLLLLLAVPKSWLIDAIQAHTSQTVVIELSKPAATTKESAVTTDTIKRPPEPVVRKKQQPQKQNTKQVIEPKPIAIPKKNPKTNPKEQAKQPKLRASDVQIMMSKAIDPKIEDAAFGINNKQNNFIAKKYEASNMYADLPYLDESVDAPQLELQFYAEGFTGNIERFFDAITYEKTFTTKYGTKISCAVVGVLAMCGWK